MKECKRGMKKRDKKMTQICSKKREIKNAHVPRRARSPKIPLISFCLFIVNLFHGSGSFHPSSKRPKFSNSNFFVCHFSVRNIIQNTHTHMCFCCALLVLVFRIRVSLLSQIFMSLCVCHANISNVRIFAPCDCALIIHHFLIRYSHTYIVEKDCRRRLPL